MATFYSLAHLLAKTKLAWAGLFLLLLAGPAAAEDKQKIYYDRAAKEFLRTQAQFQSATNNTTNAWVYARACFELTELATNKTQRADLARLGIAACRQALVQDPKSAPAHYYLAMNCGWLADAQAPSLASYLLVHEIENEFKTAAELDEHFEFAGAVRNLGLLYYQAPGWPISVGNKRKAREWLERAATLAPDYPESLLNLVEAQLKWREADEAEKTLQRLDLCWPAALTNLIGTAWEPSWDDWQRRRQAAKRESGRLAQERKPR